MQPTHLHTIPLIWECRQLYFGLTKCAVIPRHNYIVFRFKLSLKKLVFRKVVHLTVYKIKVRNKTKQLHTRKSYPKTIIAGADQASREGK